MSELQVYCGGLKPQRSHRDAILLNTDAKPGTPEKVNLEIGDLPSRLADNVPEVLLDLLEIAAYVYFADQSASRGGTAMKHMGADWRRRFRLHVPVRAPETWRHPEVVAALTKTLGFLTEDEFRFEFTQADRTPTTPYLGFSDPQAAEVNPDHVVLFSGGIDSFVGVADLLLGQGRRVAMVTQRSSTLLTSKQTALICALRDRAAPRALAFYPVSINKGSTKGVEFTQRSRSFMFAALALIVAHMSGRHHALFFENGVVSINLPVAEHVLGARASRTTHPRFLSDSGKLFSLLRGQPFEFRNPFIWKTKTEVLQAGVDAGVAALLGETFSCTRVREAAKTGLQCGVCSQCVDRRFAFAAAGLEPLDAPNRYNIEIFEGAGISAEKMVVAEGVVLRARRLAAVSKDEFLGSQGEVYRALPYLPGSWEERTQALFDLHRRHGLEVRSVLDHKIKTLGVDLTNLPSGCLISMIVSEVGPEPARQPATELPPPRTVEYRPITFTAEKDRVQFLGGPTFAGGKASVINGLLAKFDTDTEAGIDHDTFRFTRAKDLAKAIGIDETTLRQRIGRLRRALEQGFLKTSDQLLDENDIIENREWRGYRLNPYLLHLTAEQFRTASMSRNFPGSVTTPISSARDSAIPEAGDVTSISGDGIAPAP